VPSYLLQECRHCRHAILWFPLKRNAAIVSSSLPPRRWTQRNSTQREGRRGGRTLEEGDEGDETVMVDRWLVVWWMHATDDVMDQGDPSQARTDEGNGQSRRGCDGGWMDDGWSCSEASDRPRTGQGGLQWLAAGVRLFVSRVSLLTSK
jgi:hypothetical protein